jgi:RND family efflux transporter MFP subunit
MAADAARRAMASGLGNVNRMFSYRVGVVVVSAVVAAGCGGDEPVQLQAQSARPPVKVELATVTGRDEPVTVEATGSFEAAESSDVAPESPGVVVATPVDAGQFVRAGAVLVRLQGTDPRLVVDEAKAAVSRAEANVRLAEAQQKLAETTSARYATLLSTGDVSHTVAEQARTQAETALQTANTARASLAEARAQLARASHDLTHISVVAPFAGYINERKVSVGEYVQPSTPVVTLLKTDPLRLKLNIPGAQAGQIKVGQQVTATVDAFPGRTFAGEIAAVNPALNPESRTFTAEGRVPNPEATLKPGMFAVATIAQGGTTRNLLVPKSAVVEDVNTNSYRLFAIDNQNRARLRVLQLAPRQQGDQVIITSGVKEGERVATSSLGDLYDGAPVEIAAAPR